MILNTVETKCCSTKFHIWRVNVKVWFCMELEAIVSYRWWLSCEIHSYHWDQEVRRSYLGPHGFNQVFQGCQMTLWRSVRLLTWRCSSLSCCCFRVESLGSRSAGCATWTEQTTSATRPTPSLDWMPCHRRTPSPQDTISGLCSKISSQCIHVCVWDIWLDLIESLQWVSAVSLSTESCHWVLSSVADCRNHPPTH